VRKNLCDPDLAPDSIAQACGISLRYLHLLFKDAEASVCQWIREKRLQSAYEMLQKAAPQTSIAQIAYAVGFSDHAQFSNAFRKKFGQAPSELRAPKMARGAGRVPVAGIEIASGAISRTHH